MIIPLRPPPPRSLPSTLSALTKFPISLVATATAVTGHLAFRRTLAPGLLWLFLGTLLLAMSASVLNEVQEKDLDALMARTRARPLPSGAVSAQQALLLAAALGIAGTLLLRAAFGWPPALLGLGAMGWYLGVYTPLKRVSAFAVVPGAVIGALPPAMGWTAAGGSLGDPALVALCILFFLWQVPHFWLLTLIHQAGYEAAGFPTLARHFDDTQILRLIFTWTCGTVATCGLLALFHSVHRAGSLALLGFGSLALLLRFGLLFRTPEGPPPYRRAFVDINLYALLVMAAVIFGNDPGPRP